MYATLETRDDWQIAPVITITHVLEEQYTPHTKTYYILHEKENLQSNNT